MDLRNAVLPRAGAGAIRHWLRSGHAGIAAARAWRERTGYVLLSNDAGRLHEDAGMPSDDRYPEFVALLRDDP